MGAEAMPQISTDDPKSDPGGQDLLAFQNETQDLGVNKKFQTMIAMIVQKMPTLDAGEITEMILGTWPMSSCQQTADFFSKCKQTADLFFQKYINGHGQRVTNFSDQAEKQWSQRIDYESDYESNRTNSRR